MPGADIPDGVFYFEDGTGHLQPRCRSMQYQDSDFRSCLLRRLMPTSWNSPRDEV